MADKKTTFTITSQDVLGNKPVKQEITTNVSTPTVTVDRSTQDITSKTDNIILEVDLANLGEHRQPDRTKFIFQPDTYSVPDLRISLVDKASFDISSAKDLVQNISNLGKFEILQTPEKVEIVTEKPFFDEVDLTEFVEQLVGKKAFDTSSATETDEKLIEPDKFDEVATPELVEKVLFKSIFDTIGVTDDFYGAADPDDDQTAHVRDNNFDTSGVTDFSYRNIFKSIVDTVKMVEDFEANDGTIKEISTIVDIFAAHLSRPTEDTSSTTDFAVFNTDLGKQDTATTSDILSTVITFFRDYVDTATAADSGRLNLHNYTSQEYMLEDYTGTNSFF
jgi:hypothetical protein